MVDWIAWLDIWLIGSLYYRNQACGLTCLQHAGDSRGLRDLDGGVEVKVLGNTGLDRWVANDSTLHAFTGITINNNMRPLLSSRVIPHGNA